MDSSYFPSPSDLLNDLKGRIKEVEKDKTFTVGVRKRRYSVTLHHDREEGDSGLNARNCVASRREKPLKRPWR
jgi:hypothetical protein